MRLKSEVFVQALLRIAAANGAIAMLVRRGDTDAGAIFVRINRLDGSSSLYGPAPAGIEIEDGDRRFTPCFPAGAKPDLEVEAYLARQLEFDRDVWVVEIEDRRGRSFLDDWLAAG